jgi:HD superfamily phosphohydrolase
MYLAMQTAIALLRDEISRERIKCAFERDNDIKSSLDDHEVNKLFVFISGICGLLHDLGHAPFSHTLEDAVFYTYKNIYYNHEETTFIIAKEVLKNFRCLNGLIAKITLTVLNKKLKDISPLKRIIRSMIDDVIDVDKGDYLLRDSYHCGVIYGLYDKDRLWRNVRVTSDWRVGVTEKGAIEAWNLRLARYKMYKNVYKHHVRNITDALLIDILSRYFDGIGEEEIREVFPVPLDHNPDLDENDILKFLFWTENDILRKLSDYRGDAVPVSLESFMKRSLPKRFLTISLEKFGIPDKDKDIVLSIKKIFKELQENYNLGIFFLIYKDHIPPIFSNDVQRDLRIVLDRENELSVAEYLNFSIQDDDLDKYSVPELKLEIFAEQNTSEDLKTTIVQKLKKIL